MSKPDDDWTNNNNNNNNTNNSNNNDSVYRIENINQIEMILNLKIKCLNIDKNDIAHSSSDDTALHQWFHSKVIYFNNWQKSAILQNNNI